MTLSQPAVGESLQGNNWKCAVLTKITHNDLYSGKNYKGSTHILCLEPELKNTQPTHLIAQSFPLYDSAGLNNSCVIFLNTQPVINLRTLTQSWKWRSLIIEFSDFFNRNYYMTLFSFNEREFIIKLCSRLSCLA